MASIYDTVSYWSNLTTYKKYDIVKGSDDRFYYSIKDSNVSNNPITLANLQVHWEGYISLNGILVPNFWWKPSYNASIEISPQITVSQFGNGYQQRISDGINSALAKFTLNFEGRSENETVSILHFLKERASVESFIYNPPTIYKKSHDKIDTRYVSINWTSSYISYDMYIIQTTLLEVPV